MRHIYQTPWEGTSIVFAVSLPFGTGFHGLCISSFKAPKGNPKFEELLREYHKITTNRHEVSCLLEREHGIYVRRVTLPAVCNKAIILIILIPSFSDRTIARRWRELGLTASKATESSLTPDEIVGLVAEQMAMDPSGHVGQNALKKQIALRTGHHLKR
jgi:hypothetical protein